jgi:type 1 glutamine amidotransferase
MNKSLLLLVMLTLSVQVSFAKSLKLLVFSKTSAYRHVSAINAGNSMFSSMAATHHWSIEFTETSTDFTKANLRQYDAIIWNNVSGNVLNENEEVAFKSFINEGGGYVGIHNAANAETNWPWYVDLLGGATFLNHATGSHQIQSVSINLENDTDSITSHFADSFSRTDEWYNFTSNPTLVDQLLSIDESTLAGPNMGGEHPITWKHEYDGGRAFYTGFGHTESSFSEPDVVTMFTEAVKWVATAKSRVIVDEFNGATEPGVWAIQAPYDAYDGTFPFKTTNNKIEITGVLNGPNQQLVREGVTIDASLPYTIETKFKILYYGGIRSFAINFLQANQPATQRLNAWSLNLDLAGPIIKYMGFVNGSFDAIGSRRAPWAVQNQEYIYKIDVNRRLNGDVSLKWVTATISKPDGTVMDKFEVDYSRFRWQPSLNEPVKFGLNSHYASWVASDLKVFYTDEIPNDEEGSNEEDPTEVDSRLVAYWPFDGDADDVSGNSHHAVENNNPSYPAAHLNKGLEANGAYVSVDSDPFDVSKFTLMAWIKPEDVSGTYRVIFEKDKLKSDWYGLYQVGNKLHVRWGVSGYTTATTMTLQPNVFTHVAATFDGVSAKIFINGILKHSVLGSSSTPSVTKGEFRIGISGVGTEAFQGIIDEAKVFGTALNQSKIQIEMESSSVDEGDIPDPVTPTPSEVAVTGVVISSVPSTLNIDEMSTLIATVSPANANNKNRVWKSDDPLIVHVNSSGVLTGVANGTTTITATTVDGGHTDTVSVTVFTATPPPITEPSINLVSVAEQIASLKVLSWNQIGDYATRRTANARLLQAKSYFNLAAAYLNKGKASSGKESYLKISASLIKQYISILENGVRNGKQTEMAAHPLLNEANSINGNINFLLTGQQPLITEIPDTDISLTSISDQIISLIDSSGSQIGDYAIRRIANIRLLQAKSYFNIGKANFNRGRTVSGKYYLRVSTSVIKKYIAIIKKGKTDNKLTGETALSLLNEASSINTNINLLISE